jgi:cell division protease FtsH
MDKKPRNKRNPNQNRKVIINLLVLVALFLIFILSVSFFDSEPAQEAPNEKTFSELITEIREGDVSKLIVSEDKTQIVAEIYENPENPSRDQVREEVYPNISPETGTPLEHINNALGEETLNIGTSEGQIIYEQVPKSLWTQISESPTFQIMIQIAIIALIALFILKKLGDLNSRSISFGSSRAKMQDKIDTRNRTTFGDVAGNEEAKQELTEVIDFLKRPEEYIKMGAKIPKGVLLVGSPGTGKTLMAKAVAGEADVPFFYISGSEFVEMFVGVGASRVRDLFAQAKKKNPCVVFIDEIDAVGRQRGYGLGSGNDEREQTLNQILTEMDGFEPTTTIIVIGATNRPDVLDPALLRPGRFDRQITVTMPDRAEREKILQVHSSNKKLAKDVDLGVIARRTPGFSGADLMNVVNEAAILTVRARKAEINNEIFREAIEKVLLGPSLKSKIVTEEQKKLTAYHEAGHALVATVLPQAKKVQKVTIIPRGRAAGYTFSDSGEQDPLTRKRSEFMAEISVLFGGYVVEQEIYNEVTTGASNDLSKATEIARDMVMRFGMSDLGPIAYQEEKHLAFLGKEMTERDKQYSESSAEMIDREIRKILNGCYDRTKEIIQKFKKELELVTETLLEKEVLEYEEFNELVKYVANPPFPDPKKATAIISD